MIYLVKKIMFNFYCTVNEINFWQIKKYLKYLDMWLWLDLNLEI